MATSPPSSAPLLPAVQTSLRRPAIIAGVLGLLALMITGLLHHVLFGFLICFGLALGLANMKLVQNAVTKVTATDNPSKQRMAYSSASRLLIITAIALVIGFLLKPDGIGVFVGLAISQVVIVLNTTLPVLKGLRQQS